MNSNQYVDCYYCQDPSLLCAIEYTPTVTPHDIICGDVSSIYNLTLPSKGVSIAPILQTWVNIHQNAW